MAKKRQPVKTAHKQKRRKPTKRVAPKLPEPSAELTHKQRRFVEEYVVDFNGTRAAKAAGYSARSASETSYDLLRNPRIDQAIKDALLAMREATLATRDRIIAELLKMGFSNALDYIRILPDGEPAVDFSALTRDQAAAITEVTVEDYTDGRGEDAREVKRVRYKVADKGSALMNAAKLMGHVTDKVEQDIKVRTTKAEHEERVRRLSDEELAVLRQGQEILARLQAERTAAAS